ncbi:hypothetical protein K435DRAFT_785125 [Dendrothele bispora CBS 962.96]|uniref:F-box domain-containing protein n=1 Tax=Dendrothele bispora (strain CBS 962.96) TaxID=1314807 RepID=A0A4S8KYR0_DENBC|nr:hypothetical protein K435DRAFT_785125 [Dendrothele bispora CBS 962.96]
MFASGSKSRFPGRLLKHAKSESSDLASSCSDSESLAEVDFSPIILCADCLCTFHCSERACDPLRLSNIRAKHVPSPTESVKIQSYVDDLNEDLSRYYLEIRRLKRVLKRLTQQRDVLEREREESLTLLSPIRRLPPEVLSHIFEYHCQTDAISLGGRELIKAPALTLSHVCSFWRALSLSLPSLWSRLDFNFHFPLAYGPIHLFHLFLQNSESAPLELNLVYPTTGDFLVSRSFLEVSHRWQTVTISSDLDPELDPPQNGFPVLTSLSLRNCSSTVLFFFKEAPALRYLSLDGIVPIVGNAIALPFSPIETVVINDQDTLQVLSLLQKLPGLRSVEILECFEYLPQLNLYHIQLEHLTSLTLSTFTCNDILQRITTPVLRSLEISSPVHNNMFGHNGLPFSVQVFVDYLSRSFIHGTSSLEQLLLSRVEISASDLLDILRLTRKLKHLRIRDDITDWVQEEPDMPYVPQSRDVGPITNSFLRSLTVKRRGPSSGLESVLAPELHTIDIVTHPSRIDYGVLADLVASRSQSNLEVGLVSPLRNVSVRQGIMWLPVTTPVTFVRPVVTLQPVMLVDSLDEDGGMATTFNASAPDLALMDEREIAHWRDKVESELERTEHGPDVQDVGRSEGMVEKVKERIFKYLWWGGSIVTPEFSFVRLISGRH